MYAIRSYYALDVYAPWRERARAAERHIQMGLEPMLALLGKKN